MGKEEYFISKFKNATIGDDGAIIGNKIYSKDLFCEDIHFKRSWMSLAQIAKKSMLVNLSDAIAMNAKPKYALIGIVIPSNFSYKELDELGCGFNEVAKEYGVRIIGGDTTSGEKLFISITIISEAKKPTCRKVLKQNQLVAYTGKIGQSAKGLKRLFQGGKLHSKSRFITPELKGKFFYNSAPYIYSALDISDGLSKDLSRLCKKRVGIKFLKKLGKNELCSGEEYEMLFSFEKRYKAKIENLAKKHRVKLNIFAKVTRGKYTSCCKENHF